MTLEQIYNRHARGSPAFIREVRASRVYDMSASEIRRLSLAAKTAEEFDRFYLLRAFWRDDFEPRRAEGCGPRMWEE